MSQVPPPLNPQVAYSQNPTPVPTNKSAIASLVFGLLGCIPWITGLLAIVFGVIGLRNTRGGRTGGKALAIIGLILGVVTVAAWTLFSGAIFALVAGTAPVRDAGKQFIHDIADGKVDAALAECTSDLTKADLETMAAAVKPLGALTDVTTLNIAANIDNGVKTAVLAGVATFANRPMTFTLNLVKQNDQWKVRGVDYDTTKK